MPIREGTSLRNFLSKMLNCKPKRISKKFEGSDYNGKQVYVSQPYKLTAEEARRRRDRLCELERKFHQSVAELKKAEGLKQQAMKEDAGPSNSAVGGGLDPAQFNGSFGNGLEAGGFGGGGGVHGEMPQQGSHFLEELAFQDMLRRRQQQHQQLSGMQGQPSATMAGAGAGAAGSFVDPLLSNLGGFSTRQHMNTTPLSSASEYWRRQQALLEASTQLDSLRMSQGGMGMQRSNALDPGNLRDLRMPPSMNMHQQAGLSGNAGYDFDDSKDGASGSPLKKRKLQHGGEGRSSMKVPTRKPSEASTELRQLQQQQQHQGLPDIFH